MPLTDRRAALIPAARRLVVRFAQWLQHAYEGLVTPAELVALGNEGLVEAAARYRSDRGVPFEGYAKARVLGAMLDGIREEATHRSDCRALCRLARERMLDADSPSSSERFSLFGTPSERTVTATRAATIVAELLPDACEPEARADDARHLERIDAFAQALDPRDRALLRTILEGATVPEIASAMGWSHRTTERRKAALLRRLNARLARGRPR